MEFYDSLFEEDEFTQVMVTERMTFWQGADFTFAIAIPFDGAAATHGNGTIIGFTFRSSADVERLYNRAIELGGTCEGPPGERGPRFSAYVRDLDKNKLGFSSVLSEAPAD